MAITKLTPREYETRPVTLLGDPEPQTIGREHNSIVQSDISLRMSHAYRAVDNHVRRRFRRWLCKKHKVTGTGISRFPDDYLYQTLGLVRLSVTTRNFPWAKA